MYLAPEASLCRSKIKNSSQFKIQFSANQDWKRLWLPILQCGQSFPGGWPMLKTRIKFNQLWKQLNHPMQNVPQLSVFYRLRKTFFGEILNYKTISSIFFLPKNIVLEIFFSIHTLKGKKLYLTWSLLDLQKCHILPQTQASVFKILNTLKVQFLSTFKVFF